MTQSLAALERRITDHFADASNSHLTMDWPASSKDMHAYLFVNDVDDKSKKRLNPVVSFDLEVEADHDAHTVRCSWPVCFVHMIGFALNAITCSRNLGVFWLK